MVILFKCKSCGKIFDASCAVKYLRSEEKDIGEILTDHVRSFHDENAKDINCFDESDDYYEIMN